MILNSIVLNEIIDEKHIDGKIIDEEKQRKGRQLPLTYLKILLTYMTWVSESLCHFPPYLTCVPLKSHLLFTNYLDIWYKNAFRKLSIIIL